MVNVQKRKLLYKDNLSASSNKTTNTKYSLRTGRASENSAEQSQKFLSSQRSFKGNGQLPTKLVNESPGNIFS